MERRGVNSYILRSRGKRVKQFEEEKNSGRFAAGEEVSEWFCLFKMKMK